MSCPCCAIEGFPPVCVPRCADCGASLRNQRYSAKVNYPRWREMERRQGEPS